MKRNTIILSIISAIFIIFAICFILFSNKMQSNMLVQSQENQNKLAQKTDEHEIYSFISEQQKSKAEESIVFAHMKSQITPKELKENADNIAIVRIISLDSSSAEFDSIVGNTYGKMIINTNLKGNLVNGDVVEYASTGGYLTIAEWEKYQPTVANEKRDYLRAENGIEVNKETEYIHLQLRNCIDVEEGCSYLAYFTYNESMQKYKIIGLQTGLMKLNIPKENNTISLMNSDYNNVEVFNNNTQKYENLQEYINKNITSIVE